jgi:hypothetical protein
MNTPYPFDSIRPKTIKLRAVGEGVLVLIWITSQVSSQKTACGLRVNCRVTLGGVVPIRPNLMVRHSGNSELTGKDAH